MIKLYNQQSQELPNNMENKGRSLVILSDPKIKKH